MSEYPPGIDVLSPGSWDFVQADHDTGSGPGAQGAKRSFSRWGVGGFTLIELLVAISIIGVLMALLLPSLSAAREAAASTLCASRERQVALVIHAYKTDNMQWFPVNNTYDTGASGDNGATRHPKFAYRKGTASGQIVFVQQVRTYLQIPEPGQSGYDSRRLHPGRNILACPASDYRPGMTTAQGQQYAVINDGTQVSNYVISAYFGWGDPFLWDPRYTATGNATSYQRYSPKRGEPVAPSRLVLGGEALGASTYFGYLMPNYLPNYYAYFHPNGTANVMLADGHVVNVVGHVGKWDPTIYEFYNMIR